MRAALLAIAGLTVYRLAFLAVSPLGLDFEEAQYWLWSRELAAGYVSKPPLIAWLIAAATSILGNGEAGIRAASPVLQGATAVVIGLLVRRLAGEHPGALAALLWATAPGVSFSSLLMTTDVPLLFFWSLTLYALVRVLDEPTWRWPLVAGAAAGLGFLSKYAMVYAAAALLPAGARRRRFALAGAVAGLLALPNVAWNLEHGFATVRHTASLAGWDGLHAGELVVFALLQFVILGPVPFALALHGAVATARARRGSGPSDPWRLVAALFAAPLVLVAVQALLGGANANWAAPAHVAGAALAAREMAGRRIITRVVLAVQLVVAVAIGPVLVAFPVVEIAGRSLDLGRRYRGYDELGRVVAREVAASDARILAVQRPLLARIGYAARLPPSRLVKWNPDGVADDQFELRTSLRPGDEGPLLLVTEWPETPAVTRCFRSARALATVDGTLGRRHWIVELRGFRGYGVEPPTSDARTSAYRSATPRREAHQARPASPLR